MPESRKIIDAVAERIDELPLADSAVLGTLSLLDDPNTDLERLAEALSPTVALRFLDIAAGLEAGTELRSIHHAVKCLGCEKMKQVLISSILLDHFTRQPDHANFSFNRFSEQAHLCAAISGALGRIVDYPAQEDIFTAALLHNVGKMAVAVYFPKKLDTIIDLKQSRALPTHVAEKRVLGADHAEIGAAILARFRLPADICEAVRHHEDAELSTEAATAGGELLMILRAASQVTARFTLPAAEDAAGVAEMLSAAVDNGRLLYRKKFSSGRLTPGYMTAIGAFLTTAGGLIEMDLKKFLAPRKLETA
jgi:HD-like signal output (HDOD) protein